MSSHDVKPKAENDADATVNTALADAGRGTSHASGATFHDDSTSHAAADALGARAFTAGSDVYFGAGQLAPATESGSALIQHELTHVEQARGVAAPAPGNFAVSSTSDGAEVAARDGSAGGSAAAHTIYRDETPGGGGPATTGTGPAASGGGPAPGGPSGGTAETGATADPYEAWKASIAAFNGAEAVTKWAAVPAGDKRKFAAEGGEYHRRVVHIMKKDAVKVLKEGGVDIAADPIMPYTIFHAADFPEWYAEMKTHLLLTPFLNAEPLTTHLNATHTGKLKTWIGLATTKAEAVPIFQKAYPALHDVAPAGAIPNANWGTSAAWALPQIKRLFNVLADYVATGHVATITGGFYFVTGAGGWGWWNSVNKWVFLPDPGAGAQPDGTGEWAPHDMTGGTGAGIARTDTRDANGSYNAMSGRQQDPSFKDKDGNLNPAGIGHFTGTILHEVGHGVGNQLDGGRGDKYAEDSGSWPGFHKITANELANGLWVSGTSPVGAEPTGLHRNAKLDEEHAKAFFRTELASGRNSYSLGWATADPPRDHMARYCTWKYGNTPLYKFWDFFVVRGHPKADSYRWDEDDARIPPGSDWCYAFLSRGGMGWTKFKAEAWRKKVSYYSMSSPKEWFAEQYTHFYRTGKSGSGLDADTCTLLKDLDKLEFVPTGGTGGVTITDHSGTGSGGGGAGSTTETGEQGAGAPAAQGAATQGAGADGSAQRRPGPDGPNKPLMFPW
jgi:hypothetical protein